MGGRYRKVLALAGVFGLAAAACGSDDGSGATPTTADVPAPTEAPATTEPQPPETDAPETTVTEPAPSTTEVPDDLPLIVTTTTIWADVVDNVVCGDLAEVVNIVPAGADSHDFEPSLQDRGLMGDADLVVINGLFLEEGLLGTIEAVEDEGVPVFAIAEAISDLIEFDGDHDHGDDDHGDDDHGHDHGDDDHDHGDDDHGDDDHGHGDDDHGHDHGDDDPHVWFDPARVASALPLLGDEIVAATGIDAAQVSECLGTYQAELLDTDAAMVEAFSVIEDDMRKLVSTHESLGYLADRYDFEIIGTVLTGTSSLAETNPADLEDLANDIIAAGVPAIFAEAETSSADIEALAGRIGDVEVITLLTESLGEPGGGADTYVTFLLDTATTIADALGETG